MKPVQGPNLMVLFMASAELLRMRYQHMFLTNTAVPNTKPAGKPRKLADGGGLHLLVTPGGGKPWRLSYRYSGKQKTLSLRKSGSSGIHAQFLHPALHAALVGEEGEKIPTYQRGLGREVISADMGEGRE
jgi:hypothetical protein